MDNNVGVVGFIGNKLHHLLCILHRAILWKDQLHWQCPYHQNIVAEFAVKLGKLVQVLPFGQHPRKEKHQSAILGCQLLIAAFRVVHKGQGVTDST